jgi:hypothetical protein
MYTIDREYYAITPIQLGVNAFARSKEGWPVRKVALQTMVMA